MRGPDRCAAVRTPIEYRCSSERMKIWPRATAERGAADFLQSVSGQDLAF